MKHPLFLHRSESLRGRATKTRFDAATGLVVLSRCSYVFERKLMSEHASAAPSFALGCRLSPICLTKTSSQELASNRSVRGLWIFNWIMLAYSMIWAIIDQDGPFGDAAKWYICALIFYGLKRLLKCLNHSVFPAGGA
jgi:hypothetical protein